MAVKTYLLALLLIILSCSIASLAFATSFTSTPNPPSADSGSVNSFLNFTIANSGPANITSINITLPANFSFVLSSNGTNAADANFLNISSTSISWTNLSAAGIVNSSSQFWFNVSVPKSIYGTYRFNISSNDTSGSWNSTNASVEIERTAWSSPLSQFYAKPAEIFLNATNSYQQNISLFVNTSWMNISVELLNDTTDYPDSGLAENYSQSNSITLCQRIPLLIKNGTLPGTVLGPLNSTILNATLIHNHPECYPGRYRTERFTIRNLTLTNETANLTIYLDIPISIANTLNNATGIGSFSGQLPANTTAYHSYYFNATSSASAEMPNATAVLINVSAARDVDIFLLDSSGGLLAKSINKTGNESLLYNYLPSSPQMWEIRIYGNRTSAISYWGNIIFSTLNVLNSSGQSISSINFGTVNATSNTTTDIGLRNDGNLTLSNVAEYVELYYVRRFTGSGTQNFTFIVPDSSIAKAVKASLSWSGASNYSFVLTNQSGYVVANSSAKHSYANKSGVAHEEYADTSTIGSTAKAWTVHVLNQTNSTDSYNLTVYIYMNASDWIATNYSTTTLNRTGGTGSFNYTAGVKINLTVPGSKAMNGSYEGYIKYLDSRQAGVSIGLQLDVTAPMLVVNDSLSSDTYRLDEDYGANLTRTMRFNISNPGAYSLVLNFTDSGGLTYGSLVSSFAYSTVNSIPANSSNLIEVNITFNSSLPVNSVSTGWIKINATNETANLTARPYSLYTINLQLNLTNLLDVRTDFRTADWSDKDIYNSSVAENITIRADLYYFNGTGPFTDLAGLTNVSSVWIQENNVTGFTGRFPARGNLSFFNGFNPIYCTGSCPAWGGDNHYYINATIPANLPGGLYKVYLMANYSSGSSRYGGIGSNGTLVINNTGLLMSTNASSCIFNGSCVVSSDSPISMSNASTYRLYVNVSNFGPQMNSSATVSLSESCSGFSASEATYSSSCSAFDVPAHNTSCIVYWVISAGTSAAGACDLNIIGKPESQWFNHHGINISIQVTAPSGSSSTPPGSGGVTTPSGNVSYGYNLSFTKAESLIIVQQKSSNTTTVIVKNTGNATQTINFTVQDINASWYTINSSLAAVSAGKEAAFNITFIVDKVEIKDYSGSFKANSSKFTNTSSFTLRVMPAPEENQPIIDKMGIYQLNLVELGEQINSSKANKYNTTVIEQNYEELKDEVRQAKSDLDAGDYFSAYQHYARIDSLIALVLDGLANAQKIEEKPLISIKTLVIIIVVVAVAAILIYLFWPTKEYSKPAEPQRLVAQPVAPEYAAQPEKKKNIFERLLRRYER